MGACTFLMALITKQNFKIEKSMVSSIFFAAIFQLATILLLNISYHYIPSGNATLLHFMYPIFVSFILFFYYRNKLSKNQIIALVLSFIGVICFMDFNNLNNMFGITLALISGLMYAVYMVILEKRNLASLSSWVLMTYLCLIETVILFILGLSQNSFAVQFDVQIIMYLVLLVRFSMLTQIRFQKGTYYIGAVMTSLFSLFEPLTSLIACCVFLNDPFGFMNVIGCACICIGIIHGMNLERK